MNARDFILHYRPLILFFCFISSFPLAVFGRPLVARVAQTTIRAEAASKVEQETLLKALDDQTAQVLRRVDTKANEKVEKLGVVKVGHRDRKRNFNGI